MRKSPGKPVPVNQGSSHVPSSVWRSTSHATPRSTAGDRSPAASSASSAHAVCDAALSPRPIHSGSR